MMGVLIFVLYVAICIGLIVWEERYYKKHPDKRPDPNPYP